jgi:predicted phosphoribosyltransferase
MDAERMARDVAKELRRRGIWADYFACVVQIAPNAVHNYSMYHSDFDNLSANEVADVIQTQEARLAQEHAGDI